MVSLPCQGPHQSRVIVASRRSIDRVLGYANDPLHRPSLPIWRAVMSALQQSSICGLRNRKFPYRGEACQGHRAAGQSPPNRAVSYRGGSRRSQDLRSSVTVAATGQDQQQGSRERGMKALSRLAAIAASAASAGGVLANTGAAWAGLGQPSPWQMDLQDSASPVMQDVASFHFFLLWVIAAISAFVLALLLIVIVRFNARANPAPSRTTITLRLKFSGPSFPSSSSP